MSSQAWYAGGYEPQSSNGCLRGRGGVKPSVACRLRAKGGQQPPEAGGREPGWKRQGDKSPLMILNDHGFISS